MNNIQLFKTGKMLSEVSLKRRGKKDVVSTLQWKFNVQLH